MSQKERLLNYLENNPSIDPLESWQRLGIYRLAAVVHLLKKDGHDIVSDRKSVKNKFDEGCTVAVYSLRKPLAAQTTMF